MYVAVSKVKAAWVYGNPFHSFSHGYFKKLSKMEKKSNFGVYYMARRPC